MGILDYFKRKANELSSRNADYYLQRLGVDLAKLPPAVQARAYSDMCNAMFVVEKMGAAPLNVGECALWKLASIYVQRKCAGGAGAAEIASLIPKIGGRGAESVRPDVAQLAESFMRGQDRQTPCRRTPSLLPRPRRPLLLRASTIWVPSAFQCLSSKDISSAAKLPTTVRHADSRL